MAVKKAKRRKRTMKIKPVGDRVLVFFEQKEKSRGGIILAKSAQKKPEYCTVLVAGSGVKNKDLKPGVKIIAHRYAGTDIELGGLKASLVREKDIIAILDDVR